MGPTSPSIRTNDARADSGVGSSPPTASVENATTARPLTTGPTTISAPPSEQRPGADRGRGEHDDAEHHRRPDHGGRA